MSGYAKDHRLIPEGVEYLTTVEVARYLGMHPGSVSNWRLWDEGPPFVRFGRLVRYPKSALMDWAMREGR